MPTNSEILSFAPGAGYLAANDSQKSVLFNNFARLNPLLPRQIYALYFVIKKIFDLDPDYPGMDVACNYLWEIMGRYGLQSQGLSGGGGSVTPITPSSFPNQLNFIVDSTGTILIDGQTTVTLSSFIGFNLLVIKNGTPLTQITSAPVYYTWIRETGFLSIYPAAFLGDEFQLTAA